MHPIGERSGSSKHLLCAKPIWQKRFTWGALFAPPELIISPLGETERGSPLARGSPGTKWICGGRLGSVKPPVWRSQLASRRRLGGLMLGEIAQGVQSRELIDWLGAGPGGLILVRQAIKMAADQVGSPHTWG